MPIYKIVSIPVTIPYAFDGKSGTTTKLCVCSVDDSGVTRKLSVFKVASVVKPENIPAVGKSVTLSFDEYGRISAIGQIVPEK